MQCGRRPTDRIYSFIGMIRRIIMKKFTAVFAAAVLMLSLSACGKTTEVPDVPQPDIDLSAIQEAAENFPEVEIPVDPEPETEAEDDGVMSYADYAAASVDDEVTVVTYVQAHQSWWDNKITVYCQDQDGAIFLYELACSEEDAAKLTEGTKIRVNGFKGEWAGESEIVDATFEFVDDGDLFVAAAKDLTDKLGTDELIDYQNQKVIFTDMTVVSVAFKNDQPGDDIYVTLSKDDAEYSFCLEYYLNGSDQEFYDLVSGLEAGQVVDVEGFLYWYEGANTHITSVTVK